ncbi:kinase-like domain-containing protein [Terfezia claveryi]|nr:kinase-like domain-containing protein [Terfezia claveryi]
MTTIKSHNRYVVRDEVFLLENNYHLSKYLGEGAYGIVCMATDIHTCEIVAVKKSRIMSLQREKAMYVLREITILKHFHGHPNIICLYNIDIPDPVTNNVYFYQECMAGSLQKVLGELQECFTSNVIRSIIYQILCGVKYMHSANVVHRDLTPANILGGKLKYAILD